MDHEGSSVSWGLVAIKRRWVPVWLFGWFCPKLATHQPWRWLLTCRPDELTRWRVNGHGRVLS